MLTLESTNEALEALYDTSKEVATTLFGLISSMGEKRVLSSDVNLLELLGDDKILFITEGYFRLLFGQKVVRLYSENDFVGPQHHVEDGAIVSEFASEVVLFNWSEVSKVIRENPEASRMWCSLLHFENQVNLGLCAEYVDERIQPSLELRQFQEGEVIIQEGSDPDEIYEMISGTATVTVADVCVGEIRTGEIFGEISFLVSSPRTATVIAAHSCCVRVVKKDDFFSLIEADRHLSASIAKTLAGRIVDLNRRIAEGRPKV